MIAASLLHPFDQAIGIELLEVSAFLFVFPNLKYAGDGPPNAICIVAPRRVC